MMSRLSRKCVWVIVLGALAAATLIFFAWATSGFRNWDAATWFDYWGKGKPSKVVKVVEKPAEQKAMAFTSSDGEDDIPEFVLDSDDGIATFSTEQLPTPQLSMDYEKRVLRVEVTGIVGNVYLFWTSWNDLEYSTSNKLMTIQSSSFTGTTSHVYELSFTQLFTAFNSKAKIENYCDEVGAYCFGLFAKNSKTNYLASDNAPKLYLSYFARSTTTFFSAPITEFIDNTFVITGVSNAWLTKKGFDNKYGCDLKVLYDSDPDSTALSIWGASRRYAILSNNILTVDLLALSNALATQPSSDVYHFVFTYKPLMVNVDTAEYTFYPLLMSLTKIDSFTITKLATPTNFSFNDGTLTWDSVEGANQYGVFWTEGETEMKDFVDVPSYSFDIEALGEGEHTVRVRALGNMAQTAVDNGQTMSITAYNAANVVTQVVALTYNVDGDIVTKFVPYGSKVMDYTYDVNIKGREFGGWFYDSGYSRKVEKSDVLNGDTTIYARLSDKKVTERPLTWWEQHMWQVLIPCFVVAGLGIVGGIVVGVRKKKKA